MGTLPNYHQQPDTTRKPADKARKAKEAEKCTPRTLPEIQADYRARTNYERGTGYFPMFHALFIDIIRLSSGLSCTNVIGLIFRELSIRGSGTHAIPEQGDFSVAELAIEARCDERQVNRVLEYLQTRGMATVDRLEGGRFLITLRFRQWGQIEDSYEQWDAKRRAAEEQAAAEESGGEETDEEIPVNEEIPVKEGTIALTKAPVQVRPGERSRPIKVNTGVRTLRIHWESKVLELQFQAVVTSGELVLTGNVPDDLLAKSNSYANREESTRSRHSSGHGRPNGRKIPANEGISNTTSVEDPGAQSSRKGCASQSKGKCPVQHPRAEELASLFDPLVYQHCRLTLSGDPKFHLQACEAVGDTPHDDLVKAAIERGARMLKPGHVPAVCKQIHHDWEKGKDMPRKTSKFAPPADPSKIVPWDPLGLKGKGKSNG